MNRSKEPEGYRQTKHLKKSPFYWSPFVSCSARRDEDRQGSVFTNESQHCRYVIVITKTPCPTSLLKHLLPSTIPRSHVSIREGRGMVEREETVELDSPKQQRCNADEKLVRRG